MLTLSLVPLPLLEIQLHNIQRKKLENDGGKSFMRSLLALSALLLFSSIASADVPMTGGTRLYNPNHIVGEVLFEFPLEDIEWDSTRDEKRVVPINQRLPVQKVILEVRRMAVVGTKDATMRGLFVKSGTLKAGHLVGCYTGKFLHRETDAAIKKHHRASMAAYSFGWNDTHEIDPTNTWGEVPDHLEGYEKDEQGLPRTKMTLVNERSYVRVADKLKLDDGKGRKYGNPNKWKGKKKEKPRLDLPNVVAAKEGWCKDKMGVREGFPFYALRTIRPGDEIMVCYGVDWHRHYPSICSKKEDFDDTYYTWSRDYVDVTIVREGETERPLDQFGKMRSPESFKEQLEHLMKEYEKKHFDLDDEDEDEDDDDDEFEMEESWVTNYYSRI